VAALILRPRTDGWEKDDKWSWKKLIRTMYVCRKRRSTRCKSEDRITGNTTFELIDLGTRLVDAKGTDVNEMARIGGIAE
jgi:hypothetical protein